MERRVRRNSGYTLIEILIVLVIIAILAAILFPSLSKAREGARQASCASNLQQIYQAVTLYKQDEKRYPSSLAFLLPSDANLDESTTSATDDSVPNSNGTGYLKSLSNILCPNDGRDDIIAASYGDVSKDINQQDGAASTVTADNMGRFVWNYYGYKDDGVAYRGTTADRPTDGSTGNPNNMLLNPEAAYDPITNPVKNSMSNRFAPATTIVTHCVYHRYQTSGIEADQIYDPANTDDAASALDIVMRLDGPAKTTNVSNYKNDGWQK